MVSLPARVRPFATRARPQRHCLPGSRLHDDSCHCSGLRLLPTLVQVPLVLLTKVPRSISARMQCLRCGDSCPITHSTRGRSRLWLPSTVVAMCCPGSQRDLASLIAILRLHLCSGAPWPMHAQLARMRRREEHACSSSREPGRAFTQALPFPSLEEVAFSQAQSTLQEDSETGNTEVSPGRRIVSAHKRSLLTRHT